MKTITITAVDEDGILLDTADLFVPDACQKLAVTAERGPGVSPLYKDVESFLMIDSPKPARRLTD